MQAGPPQDVRLTLEASRTTTRLMAVILALVLANGVAILVSEAMGRSAADVRLAQVFYLDGERNIPTAFSTALLLLAASLLALGAQVERDRGRPATLWWIMTAGFAMMAADEAWGFHERLTAPTRKVISEGQSGIFYYTWVVPAFILLLVLAPILLRFLASLPARSRLRFVVAGVIYVGGTVGVELVEGWHDARYGDRTLMAAAISTVQETMEMVGVVVFIRALLLHIGDAAGEVRLCFATDAGDAPDAEAPPVEPGMTPQATRGAA